MKVIEKQMSDSFRIAALLAIVGGFLDAYTYLARGGVFANAQTGNIVLLGTHIADRDFLRAASYLIPILAFVAGIYMDEWIRKFFFQNKTIHWRQIVLLIEVIVLLIVAYVPMGNGDIWANVLISFVCSMQVQSFRTVHGLPYASTMCTGNLRSATEQLFRFTDAGEKGAAGKAFTYYAVIFFFILGAGIGTVLTRLMPVSPVFVCCAILIFVYILLYKQGR